MILSLILVKNGVVWRRLRSECKWTKRSKVRRKVESITGECHEMEVQPGATQAHDCPTLELHGYDFSGPPEPRRPKLQRELSWE
jgi:hypothetical protein